MKIIFLNCWYGKLDKQLFDFIRKESKKTDAFCFQEVDVNLHTKISKVLSDYSRIESHKMIGHLEKYEISVFASNKHIVSNTKINIIKNKTIGDCMTLQVNNFILCTTHGVAQPGDKRDTVERIEQSQEILNSVKGANLPVIIGGDFNLNPETKSIKMIEDAGFRNLIKDFGIKKVRNHYAWEQAERQVKEEGLPFFGRQLFSDYCFVSKDINVKSFEVPDIEISDHLPLILEFEV